jgi:predicted regulator of amino acid metabolism with ACT domain
MQEKVDALIDEQVGDNETLRQTLKSMKPSEAMKKLEELMDNGTIKKKPSAFSRKVEELTHASVILGWADTFKQIIIRKSAELR